MSAWPIYATVFLISAATIVLEIAITRIFSFVLWYHFAFMSISIALLGYAVSGIVATRSRRLRGATTAVICAGSGALFAVSSLLGLAGVALIPLDAAGLGRDWLPSLTLGLYFVLLAVPFFFSGLAIVTVLSRCSDRANVVYCSDLIGGGVGCFLFLGLIDPLGGEGIVCFAGVLGLLAALCLARGLPRRVQTGLSAAILLLLLLVRFVPDLLPVLPKRSKEARRDKALLTWLDPRTYPEARHSFSGWNAYSRIDVVENTGAVTWLVNPAFTEFALPRTQIIIDGDAATSIVRDRGDPADLLFLSVIPSALSYQALRPASALVIGAGGGVDVQTALFHGVRRIDAVEINPLVVELMQGRFSEYSGALFSRPDVRLHVEEGRNFVRSTDGTYDLIQLTLIDTWAALASGAYSLTENYLYTVEAFQDYYRHLTPGGALAITRWLRSPPREVLRLCSVGLEALAREGLVQPERHFLVYGSPGIGTMVMRREPFSLEEVRRFTEIGASLDMTLLYDPFTTRPNDFANLFSAADRSAFFRSYPYDVAPVTDDSPFFFLQHRWRDLRPAALFGGSALLEVPGKLFLLLVLAIALLLSSVLLLAPLITSDRTGISRRGSLPPLLYFFGVGVAFMLVENLLMQKFSLFLGHPVYALSLVLFSLLIFSGLGSLASRRLVRDSWRRLGVTVGILGLVVLASFALYPAIFRTFLGQALGVRCVVTLLGVLPLGFLMGVPFPAAIRLVHNGGSPLIPWAWAVNGFASVASSALCVLLAMEFGFTAAAGLAAACYLACGGIAYSGSRRDAMHAPSRP